MFDDVVDLLGVTKKRNKDRLGKSIKLYPPTISKDAEGVVNEYSLVQSHISININRLSDRHTLTKTRTLEDAGDNFRAEGRKEYGRKINKLTTWLFSHFSFDVSCKEKKENSELVKTCQGNTYQKEKSTRLHKF